MTTDIIHDRGRGPEIAGTRITVYNLLPYFLDSGASDEYICQIYELTPAQVAAARAYVLDNWEAVLARHRQIEARIAAGNSPEVRERAKQTHDAFMKFRQSLAERDKNSAGQQVGMSSDKPSNGSPTFKEWLAERKSSPVES